MNKLRLAITTLLAAAQLMGISAIAQAQALAPVVAQVPLKATAIPMFQQELPRLTFGPAGIPVVLGNSPVDISMCEFETSILPPLTPLAARPGYTLGKTAVWGYQNSPDCTNPGGSYIGPVVVAFRNTPTQMTYINKLDDASTSKVLAYAQSTDQTLQWADPYSLQGAYVNGMPDFLAPPGDPEDNDCNHIAKNLPLGALLPTPCADNYGFWLDLMNPLLPIRKTYKASIPAAPHLHGGEIPAMLDGGPDAWWTADGIKGHGYYTNTNPLVTTPPNAAVYTYPNVQDSAPTWFHDHVLGATRLNVYAGIAGAYYQVDAGMALPSGMTAVGLMNGKPALPLPDPQVPTEELLIPLVIQDRMFDTTGQLLFPNLGLNIEHPYWVPEFVGDVIVVNGKAWPKVTVEPKRYRFLVLNGSNARAYELFLINPVTGVKGPAMYVIGNDQGYLDKPVAILPKNKAPNNKLIVMPGERYEIIIDFAGLPAGTTVLELRNTAQTPYPGGAPVRGATTGKIVQFAVGACTSGFCGATDASFNPAVLVGNPLAPPAIRQTGQTIVRLTNPVTGTPVAAFQKRRQLTLNEFIGAGGPLEILVNNTVYTGYEKGVPNATGRPDFTPIVTETVFKDTTYYSELPYEGETEIWEIINITADAHPIHPHLVAFQILNREAFNFKGYDWAYNLAFPGGRYIPGYGPPYDYNMFTPAAGVPVSCVDTANPAPPPSGSMVPSPGPGPGGLPAGCLAVGGNPDVTPYLSGVIQPPLPAEQGWKDTAISYPGEVLRIMVRFAPTGLASTTPFNDATAHYEFNPDGGHGYVWHCHIIDHEDNEMMRPFSVFPNPNAANRSVVMGVDY